MIRNTYDGTSSLKLSFGSIVLACLNGAVMPGVGFGFDAHHSGDIRERLGSLTGKVRQIEEGLGARMIEAYSLLDAPVPFEIAKEISIRTVGERKADIPLKYWTRGIGRDGSKTAWNLYNGVTQYLSHDFQGNWGRRERKSERALGLIRQFVKTGILPGEDKSEEN